MSLAKRNTEAYIKLFVKIAQKYTSHLQFHQQKGIMLIKKS
jgi:hypothetical protein